MNTHDRTDHGDALARRSASALRRDVDRRVDVDAALARVLADDARVLPLVTDVSSGRPDRRAWLGAAAAVLLVGAGVTAFALGRDGDGRVVPADATEPTTIDTAPPTPPSAPTTSAAPPDTSVPAPDTSPAPTLTTILEAPASEVDALAGLTAPPPLDPVEVPAYLPTAAVAERSQVALSEYATSTDAVTQLVQTWATEDGRRIDVTTRLGGVGAPVYTASEVVPTSVWPWDDAVVVTTMAEGYAQVHLSDPSGTVTLSGSGVTSDELISLAARMTLAPTGWRLPVDATGGLVETHSGWRRTEFATRVMRWDTGTVRGELIVAFGMPDTIRTGFFGYGTPSTLDDVRGAPAMVSEPGSGTTIAWSPAPDVVVVLGFTGTVEETLTLARSLEPVDVATWDAAGVLDTAPADGCDSYFFC